MIEIQPLDASHLLAAGDLFAPVFRRLRRAVPVLPDAFESPDETAGRLRWMVDRGQALGAFEGGRLAGYLAWYIVDDFRGTPRRGAYSPEWAHAAPAGREEPVYRALYRLASSRWTELGCGVHAISLLADSDEARRVWFWSGFGMHCVDAVRWLDPLGVSPAPGYTLHQAAPADAALLAELDAEHWRHYAAPPVFMASSHPGSPEEYADFLGDARNTGWLALEGERPAAFLRFEPHGDGSADILDSEFGMHCTGAYTRPEYRGRGLAAALLDLAIAHARATGLQRMTLDFESINPEATAFWLRYYTPVCHSLIRTPESLPHS